MEVLWIDITCERHVQKMDVTSERKLHGQKPLCRREITQMDITSHCLLSGAVGQADFSLFAKIWTGVAAL